MSQNTLQIFNTQKGGLKVQYNGYVYRKNRQSSDKIYWTCEFKHNELFKCRARLTTNVCSNSDNASLLSSFTEHNHEGNPISASLANNINELKTKTRHQPTVKTCQILQNHLASTSTSPSVSMCLPSQAALRQVVYREKKKALHTPKEPTSFDFEIDPEAIFLEGESFVIKDKIFSANRRVTLFSNKKLIAYLCEADYLIMDGTFKIVPTIYQQLYTIHGPVANGGKTFPLVFILCTHKDKASYDMMFDLLLEYCSDHDVLLDPSFIILDFEKAAMLSLRQHFENVTLNGCFFHLRQIVYRKLQREHLSSKYNNNSSFNHEIKCLLALCYVHPNNVNMYFKDLIETLSDDSRTIAEWFDIYYITGKNNKQPMYSPNFWCLTNNTSIPRTQNSAESFHHHINQICSQRHVGFYRLLAELQKETKVNLMEITKIKNGETPAKKRKRKNEANLKRIENILKNIVDYTHIELLKAIASNL